MLCGRRDNRKGRVERRSVLGGAFRSYGILTPRIGGHDAALKGFESLPLRQSRQKAKDFQHSAALTYQLRLTGQPNTCLHWSFACNYPAILSRLDSRVWGNGIRTDKYSKKSSE